MPAKRLEILLGTWKGDALLTANGRSVSWKPRWTCGMNSGGWGVKALGIATMAFAVLGALRPPTKTRHLSIGAATTMILMPHLMQDAIEQEVAAAKLPQQPAQPTRIRNKTSTVPQLKPKEGDTVSP